MNDLISTAGTTPFSESVAGLKALGMKRTLTESQNLEGDEANGLVFAQVGLDSNYLVSGSTS